MWVNSTALPARPFQCGHCGYNVASDRGYISHLDEDRRIYVCPNCDKPTYFDTSLIQVPGIAPGSDISHVPELLDKIYREARNCCAVSAFTASVLASRKILMHIAVEQGAREGETFTHYVEHLASSGFIPPNGRGWVDHIRRKGNEANHDIVLMSREDAHELLTFIEMLLKFIYEFPNRIPKAAANP